MARDAIGLMGIDMQDEGEALPEASSLADVQGGAPFPEVLFRWLTLTLRNTAGKNDMPRREKELHYPFVA